jgi:ribosomal protein RSM22 (predicted rRNA methylase)
MREWEEEQIRE